MTAVPPVKVNPYPWLELLQLLTIRRYSWSTIRVGMAVFSGTPTPPQCTNPDPVGVAPVVPRLPDQLHATNNVGST
jgi:hypothetical protein